MYRNSGLTQDLLVGVLAVVVRLVIGDPPCWTDQTTAPSRGAVEWNVRRFKRKWKECLQRETSATAEKRIAFQRRFEGLLFAAKLTLAVERLTPNILKPYVPTTEVRYLEA
jgi:hypothetical protein